MMRQIAIGLGVAVVLAAAGFLTFNYLKLHPSTAAIAQAQSLNAQDLRLAANHADARLYLAACASCHYNAGNASSDERPDLANLDSIGSADPTSLVSVIFRGKRDEMPSFGRGFSDADIAMVAAYLRATRTSLAPWADLESKVAAVRKKNQVKAGGTQP